MVLKINQLSDQRKKNGTGKKGGNNGVKFLEVIENRYRKNVRFLPFHDVDENKPVTRRFPR